MKPKTIKLYMFRMFVVRVHIFLVVIVVYGSMHIAYRLGSFGLERRFLYVRDYVVFKGKRDGT